MEQISVETLYLGANRPQMYIPIIKANIYGAMLVIGPTNLALSIGPREQLIKIVAFNLSERFPLGSDISTAQKELTVTIHAVNENGNLNKYKSGRGGAGALPLQLDGKEFPELWIGEMVEESFVKDFPATEDITSDIWGAYWNFINPEE